MFARTTFNTVDEIFCRRLLAELCRQLERPGDAQELLDDLWELAERGPHRLELAEAHLVQARIHRDCGDVDAARIAAVRAAEYAYCDGPPFTFKRAETEAQALLDELA